VTAWKCYICREITAGLLVPKPDYKDNLMRLLGPPDLISVSSVLPMSHFDCVDNDCTNEGGNGVEVDKSTIKTRLLGFFVCEF
jgi:hypothetical protein